MIIVPVKSAEKKNCRLEAHHITPKRLKGADSIHNLITLCKDCHSDVTGHEMKYAEKFYARIKGRNVYSRDAAHVMQGKTYLRTELSKIAPLVLTTGGDTANKRIDWDIEKTHSNDAIVICSLEVNVRHCELKNWQIKPMRKKSQAKTESVGGFKHRDFIRYTKKNGDQYIGYITVLNPVRKTFDMRTSDGKILKKYGVKSAELIWRFNKMYWF